MKHRPLRSAVNGLKIGCSTAAIHLLGWQLIAAIRRGNFYVAGLCALITLAAIASVLIWLHQLGLAPWATPNRILVSAGWIAMVIGAAATAQLARAGQVQWASGFFTLTGILGVMLWVWHAHPELFDDQ